LSKAANLRSESLENYHDLAQAEAVMHNFAISDSLTEQYAKLYSELFSSKNRADQPIDHANMDKVIAKPASVADWVIAFSLIILICIFSVKGFVLKNH